MAKIILSNRELEIQMLGQKLKILVSLFCLAALGVVIIDSILKSMTNCDRI